MSKSLSKEEKAALKLLADKKRIERKKREKLEKSKSKKQNRSDRMRGAQGRGGGIENDPLMSRPRRRTGTKKDQPQTQLEPNTK